MISNRTKAVLEMIKRGQDQSLLKQIQDSPALNDIDSYKSALEIILVLIERSSYSSIAINFFIDWTTSTNYYYNIPRAAVRQAVNQCLKDRTIEPYVRVSQMISRFILEFIQVEKSREYSRLVDFFNRAELLEINRFYLTTYLSSNPINGNAMLLLYGCIEDQNPNRQLILDKKSIHSFKSKLSLPESRSYYLRNCIRPYYISDNPNFPESTIHVLEPFFNQIFGSVEGFIQYLSTLKDVTYEESILIRDLLSVANHVKVHKENTFDVQSFVLKSNLHKNIRKLA